MKKALENVERSLQQTIGEQFGVNIQQLDFVPIGESSWLYKATDAEGRSLAVKVQKDNNPAVDEARRLLAESEFPYVPAIHLAKDGNVQAAMGDFYVSVEDYVEHDDVKAHDATPEKDYLITLGKILRSLHSVVLPPINGTSPIPIETFRSLYLSPAQESVVDFMDWSVDKPEARAIRDIVESNTDTINALFARSTELGPQLAAKQPELTLTHGDVHFGNILEAVNGEFYIVDWDSTIIGGVGHDLMYFSDKQLADISLGYGRDLLQDQENLQYYRNHLMLRFIWFWLNKARSSTTEQGLQAVTETIAATFDNSDYLLRALGRRVAN